MSHRTGYSKRPLAEKLGIKERFSVAILNAPQGYPQKLGKLPEVGLSETLSQNPFDFVHFFAASKKQLEYKFPKLKEKLSPSGMLWISWPKRSSAVKSDLDESGVREIGLKNGLVDVKIAAIDETWSALKFVRRIKDRK